MAKFTKAEKSWIMYDWASSAYTLVILTAILPIYFKSMYEQSGGDGATSTAYWGYANSLSTLIIALLAPILGTIADYKGYKKKFFRWFLIPGIVFTALLAIVPSGNWLLLLIFFIISNIALSGSYVFYDAFLVDVTKENKMDRVSTMGFGLGYIGSTIPFILCMALIIMAQREVIPLGVGAASQIAFLITALWWGAFSLPIVRNVHQVYGYEKEDQLVRKSFKRLFATLKDIKSHKLTFIFLIAYFFYIDGVDTIIKMATVYGTDLGISSTNLLIILFVTQIVAFPFAIIYGRLAEKFSAKTMILVGIIIYTIICIYAFFMNSVVDFWILAMLVATSQGGIQALSRSYYGKIIPKEKANEFFGFFNIFGRFATILGPLLVGVSSQLTGKSNYGVFSIIVLFIIGGIIVWSLPNEPNEKKNVAA